MPSVYEQLEKAMDDAGADVVRIMQAGLHDHMLLESTRAYALARAKFDGACAILREMEDDDSETITVTATTPPMYVKDYHPRGHRHVRGYPLDDDITEDNDCKAVD